MALHTLDELKHELEKRPKEVVGDVVSHLYLIQDRTAKWISGIPGFTYIDGLTMVPMPYWTRSGFTDGVKLLPRCEIMSGNYDAGWAQFRFVLSDARNFGYSNEYIDSLKRELNSESGED